MNKGLLRTSQRVTAIAAAALLCLALFSCGGSSKSVQMSETGGVNVTSGSSHVADILNQIDSYRPTAAVDPAVFEMLRGKLREKIIARSSGKTVSTAPGDYSSNSVKQLQALPGQDADHAAISWRERFWGDYDDNGVVDIADLQPVALYYGQRTDMWPLDPHRLVEGDDNSSTRLSGGVAVAHNWGYNTGAT